MAIFNENFTRMHLRTSIPTAPTTMAVVVAKAGMILPAIIFTQKGEISLILQFLALKLLKAETNSICQLVGSSFSNSIGFKAPL